jgi:hypothetical protein
MSGKICRTMPILRRKGGNMRRLIQSSMKSCSEQETTLPIHSSFSRRNFLSSLLAGSLLSLGNVHSAVMAGENYEQGSSEGKEDAENAIPFDELQPETRAKLLAIVDRPTLYRRLPTQVVVCDHDLHLFLVRYPEVVVNIWRLMGITTMKANRVSEYAVEGNDGAGTTARIDLVYGTPSLQLYACEGMYEGPLFKRKTTGRSVMLLRNKYGYDRFQRPVVTNYMDVFLQVDNIGLEVITKGLHNTVGKTIDVNFIETTRFIGRISDSAERNGPGMRNLSEKLQECAAPVRDEFSTACETAHARASERLAALAGPLKFDPQGRIQQPGVNSTQPQATSIRR